MSSDEEQRRAEQRVAALGRRLLESQPPVREFPRCGRMLQQASESDGRRRDRKRLYQIVIAASLMLIALSPVIAMLTRVQPPKAATSAETQEAALQHSRATRMSFDWALVEIFQARSGKR